MKHRLGVLAARLAVLLATGPGLAVRLAVALVFALVGPPVLTLVVALGVAPAADAATTDEADIARLRKRELLIPVLSVEAADLQDTYLQTRGAGARAHEALDIPAPRGTPVLAVEDGRIAKLFLSKPGGRTVYHFDESGEFVYYYAHLDSYVQGLREGLWVRKGQVIGYVGSTGNAAPESPHLHFAIFRLGPERQWWRGTPINPFSVWDVRRP